MENKVISTEYVKKNFIEKKKIENLVKIYYETNGEFAILPNGEEICLSDAGDLFIYLKELLEETENE